MDTPVLLLIFNRPNQSLQILESIRQQQPTQLFIAADGPREHKTGEAGLCEETRNTILQGIDWPCEIKTLFRDTNLGCGKAVSGALDWFFSHVEEGIILEDDCLPDPTFFSFCSMMLDRYRTHENILHVGGSNYQMGIHRGDASYYFSQYAHIWGWATWRRAWQHYDFTLLKYQHTPREGFNQRFIMDLEGIYAQKIDTWDIQWFMSVLFCKGLAITPNTNLVRNIGYGKEATHTKTTPAWFRRMVYGTLPDIIHPADIALDQAADAFTVDTIYKTSYLPRMMKKMIKENALLYNIYRRIS
jgi:hypothetical protein